MELPGSSQRPGVRLAVLRLVALACWLAAEALLAGDPRQQGELEVEPKAHQVPPDDGVDQSGNLPAAPCVAGFAAHYPCHDVDLMASLSLQEVTGATGVTLADIWGWTDAQTGREYAVIALSNGTAYVDISDPHAPRVVARTPTRTVEAPWRDVKVYRDHAFIVADGVGLHGMQVVNLTRLRGLTGPPVELAADALYFGAGFGIFGGEVLGSAHNIAINEETGVAYVVGAHETCAAGLHMVDLSTPAQPRFAGCFAEDGYTHDVQCVVYRGPDADYQGEEICVAANEDTLTFVDVTQKLAPFQISRVSYPNAAYTHQAWLTEDHAYLLSNDELDELSFGLPTRTFIWDVRDLDAPDLIGIYSAPSRAIDHNLYVHGGIVYEANYRDGLRLFTVAGIPAGTLTEIGFFDIVPDSAEPGFDGAWSVYPFFASGNVIVSGIRQGLFVLRPRLGESGRGEAAATGGLE